MPSKGLSQNMELGRLEAIIRRRAKQESVQLSGVTHMMMEDICHDAIVEVANKLHVIVREFYKTTVTVTEASGFIDISGYDFKSVDAQDLKLVEERSDADEADILEIPILPSDTFEEIKALNTTAELANYVMARVRDASISAEDRLAIEVFRGSNMVKVGADQLTYIRNPRKVTDPTKQIDFPSRHIVVVQDMGFQLLLERSEDGQVLAGNLGRALPESLQAGLTEKTIRRAERT